MQLKEIVQIKTPIVFFIFNRSDVTDEVFQAIKKARPQKLYVFADGPRKDKDELNECLETRKVIDGVDWDCEVIKKFSDVNLGCQKNISQGLDFVFNREERVIILEDDCLPNESFFRFCEELLENYKDDNRIGMISGNNFQFGRNRRENSYYFSRYFHCWGWATWRRAWKLYDHNMSKWPYVRDNKILENIFDKTHEIDYWSNIFEQVYEGKINSWAYRFSFALFIENTLSILPDKNLVTNIGFDERGTHTTTVDSPFSKMKTHELDFPLKHQKMVVRDRNADSYTEKICFSGTQRSMVFYFKKVLRVVMPEFFYNQIKIQWKRLKMV